ncbi:MAG: right-handed parallel beta-helix repeat-containing protein [Candidatus Hodarchaeota archaeon]
MRRENTYKEKKLKYILSFISIFCFISFIAYNTNKEQSNQGNYITAFGNENLISKSYIAHSVIEIIGDADEDLAEFPGTGASDDPIRIADFIIGTGAASPILISDVTTKYITIINCKLQWGGVSGINIQAGVKIKNSYNIKVENCIFEDNTHGIIVENSGSLSNGQIEIIGNTFNDPTNYGIFILGGSSNVFVKGNTILNSEDDGIMVFDSSDITIGESGNENYISNCDDDGIHLHNTHNSMVHFNTIENCNQYGVCLEAGSSGNTVENNVMNYNGNIAVMEYLSCSGNTIPDTNIDTRNEPVEGEPEVYALIAGYPSYDVFTPQLAMQTYDFLMREYKLDPANVIYDPLFTDPEFAGHLENYATMGLDANDKLFIIMIGHSTTNMHDLIIYDPYLPSYGFDEKENLKEYMDKIYVGEQYLIVFGCYTGAIAVDDYPILSLGCKN